MQVNQERYKIDKKYLSQKQENTNKKEKTATGDIKNVLH